jgi:hypothetical protein
MNSNLIPVGCPAHIVHNAAKHGGEALSCDAESIIFKIASHFCGSTLRHERLKEFCEFVNVHYMTLPTHTRTRWLTLLLIIERILKLWTALKSYFLSTEESPKVLMCFFEKEESEIYFSFLQSALTLFQQAILSLEKSDLILPEMLGTMTHLREKLVQRKQNEFIGTATATLLDNMLDGSKQQQLRKEFMSFYDITVSYIDTWFHIDRFPSSTEWLCLRTPHVSYDDIRKTAEFMIPELAAKDSLFDEVTELNLMIKTETFFHELSTLSVDQKWVTLLKNESLSGIRELVTSIFAIPTSNASVERVFSLMNAQWSEERNRLKIDTVKAILQVVMNLHMSCGEFYQKLLADERLCRLILSNKKYSK